MNDFSLRPDPDDTGLIEVFTLSLTADERRNPEYWNFIKAIEAQTPQVPSELEGIAVLTVD